MSIKQAIQLYEDDARVGHQEFDLKLTQRVKMSMVSLLLESFSSLILARLEYQRCLSTSGLRMFPSVDLISFGWIVFVGNSSEKDTKLVALISQRLLLVPKCVWQLTRKMANRRAVRRKRLLDGKNLCQTTFKLFIISQWAQQGLHQWHFGRRRDDHRWWSWSLYLYPWSRVCRWLEQFLWCLRVGLLYVSIQPKRLRGWYL